MAEFFFPIIPDGLAEVVSTTETTQELSVEVYVTEIVSDAGDNVCSLPDGLKEGQLKKIIHKTDGGECVVTLTSAQGTSQDKITLTNPGEFAVCMWNGSFWRVLETGRVTSAVDILA